MKRLLYGLGILAGATLSWGQGYTMPGGGSTAADIVGTTSVCGGGASGAANSVCLSANTVTSEGATADGFEGLIVFGDHTADATGTFIATAGGMQLSLGSGTAASTAIVLGGTAGIYRDSGTGGLGVSTGGSPQVIQNSQYTEHRSTAILTWMSTDTPVAGTRDTGLSRSAAGVVKTTAGLSGYGSLETGGFVLDRTITAAGTTGAQTINKVAFTVNFAAAATTLVVTNSTINTSSICFVQARTNDATCSVKDYEPAAGSMTIRMNAACTAETSVGGVCFN